jgi:hypothetical protein
MCVVRQLNSGTFSVDRAIATLAFPPRAIGRLTQIRIHGGFIPPDSSGQTTSITDSTDDRFIDTCLVALNVLSAMKLPCYGRKKYTWPAKFGNKTVLTFAVGSGVAVVRHLPIRISMEANSGEALLIIAHPERNKMIILSSVVVLTWSDT